MKIKFIEFSNSIYNSNVIVFLRPVGIKCVSPLPKKNSVNVTAWPVFYVILLSFKLNMKSFSA